MFHPWRGSVLAVVSVSKHLILQLFPRHAIQINRSDANKRGLYQRSLESFSFAAGIIFFLTVSGCVGAHAQTFQTAARLSLMYDPRISAATAAAEAAEARVDQANTARRPQVQFSIDANDEEDSPTQLANVDLSQQLFDFGQTDARVHVARAQADLAWMEVARSAQDVFAETAVAYANVLEADEQTVLQQGFRNEVATQVVAIQSRIDAGLGSITELYSLNRLQAEAEIAIITAQQEAVAARLELERLTGTYFDAVEASGLYDYFDLLPATVEQARFFADENSPESRLSQQEVWIACPSKKFGSLRPKCVQTIAPTCPC